MQAFRVCTRVRALGIRPLVRFNSTKPANSYYEKLQQRAKAEGLDNVDQLKEKYKEKIKEQQKVEGAINPLSAEEAKGPKDRGKREDVPPIPENEHKTLNSYVDLPKLSLHEGKDIELLWKARFADKERAICGTLNHDTYRQLFRNARYNPRFVLPVPHEGQGAELHFLQWAVPGPFTLHCMFTSLQEFKLHQEYARPHTTLAIHSELLAEKELALMNGEVEKDANVTHAQGAFLVANLQRFYANNPDTPSGLRKQKLLEAFTANSPEFTAEALMSEVETLD